MAWSVDRLSRSLHDLIGFWSDLYALKIDVFLRQRGLDTTTLAVRDRAWGPEAVTSTQDAQADRPELLLDSYLTPTFIRWF